jgi:hypothetical protein
MRLLLQYLLPLLLPFLIYLAYVAATEGRTPAWLDETPWLALAGAGVALLAVSLVTWSVLTGSPTGETYVPPRFEDGRVVPATTVDR